MVTAGVYLVTRSAPLYSSVPEAQYIVAMVGAVTALFAATIAVGQYDIKKVLAYSTISQLGFMVAAVGMGAYVAGMFHLITHAFFKALLFLSAGSVILGMERGHHHAHARMLITIIMARGKRKMERGKWKVSMMLITILALSGVRSTKSKLRPRRHAQHGRASQDHACHILAVYMIGTWLLAGIFPFAGFWSKDEILLDASMHFNQVVYWLLTIAAFFTAFYMGRQIWMVFFGEARTKRRARGGKPEGDDRPVDNAGGARSIGRRAQPSV
jgi:NADH-quinone oxidoreductase subunit L